MGMDMSFIKDNIFLIVIACMIFVAIFIWLYPNNKVQAQQQEVGKSDFGTVYIDTDTVEVVKKDGQYYILSDCFCRGSIYR